MFTTSVGLGRGGGRGGGGGGGGVVGPIGSDWNRLEPMTAGHRGVTRGLAVDGAPLPD